MWAAHHFWYFRAPNWSFYPVCWNAMRFNEPGSVFADDAAWEWSKFSTAWWI